MYTPVSPLNNSDSSPSSNEKALPIKPGSYPAWDTTGVFLLIASTLII